jgi:YVTN family beta-propeller protein
MRWTILVAALVLLSSASAAQTSGTAVALVTAERQNMLVAVELSSGKVLRRVSLPADPQNVAVGDRTVVVVSTGAGAVTLLAERSLRILKVFRGFADPHIVAASRSRRLAYVTDDGRGELVVIGLGARRIVDRVFVGAGAHHMAVSPSGSRLWIALGEHASAISIVDLSRPSRPRLLRRFSPGFVAHDLTFSPDGRRVWVTSGVGDSVHVLDARTGKQLFAVPVGAAPQHVAFAGNGFAFVTSGYSSRIVKIAPRTGRVLATAPTPYGSFNLSASLNTRAVVTTSLMSGRVTEFDTNLHRLSSVKAARAARAVALTVWPSPQRARKITRVPASRTGPRHLSVGAAWPKTNRSPMRNQEGFRRAISSRKISGGRPSASSTS